MFYTVSEKCINASLIMLILKPGNTLFGKLVFYHKAFISSPRNYQNITEQHFDDFQLGKEADWLRFSIQSRLFST